MCQAEPAGKLMLLRYFLSDSNSDTSPRDILGLHTQKVTQPLDLCVEGRRCFLRYPLRTEVHLRRSFSMCVCVCLHFVDHVWVVCWVIEVGKTGKKTRFWGCALQEVGNGVLLFLTFGINGDQECPKCGPGGHPWPSERFCVAPVYSSGVRQKWPVSTGDWCRWIILFSIDLD